MPKSQFAGGLLRDRMRDLVGNNPHAAKAVSVLVNNIVGAGIIPRAATCDDRLDEEVNKLLEDWSVRCDADGQLDFFGLQTLACRQMIEAGGCCSAAGRAVQAMVWMFRCRSSSSRRICSTPRGTTIRRRRADCRGDRVRHDRTAAGVLAACAASGKRGRLVAAAVRQSGGAGVRCPAPRRETADTGAWPRLKWEILDEELDRIARGGVPFGSAQATELPVHGLYCGDGMEVDKAGIRWEDARCTAKAGSGARFVFECVFPDLQESGVTISNASVVENRKAHTVTVIDEDGTHVLKPCTAQ